MSLRFPFMRNEGITFYPAYLNQKWSLYWWLQPNKPLQPWLKVETISINSQRQGQVNQLLILVLYYYYCYYY